MKHFVCSIAMLFIMLVSNSYAEELVKFGVNDSATTYLIKQSLVQENVTVRSIWIKYEYTAYGANNLKKDFSLSSIPSYSKVKYSFDCSGNKHRVDYAAVYHKRGNTLRTITNGNIEEVIPGTVGEAIRNFTCNYDTEKDKAGPTI